MHAHAPSAFEPLQSAFDADLPSLSYGEKPVELTHALESPLIGAEQSLTFVSNELSVQTGSELAQSRNVFSIAMSAELHWASSVWQVWASVGIPDEGTFEPKQGVSF